MARSRTLVLVAALVALAGAVGLVLFGTAPIDIFRVLDRRTAGDVPRLADEVAAAAWSSLLLAAGLAVGCRALVAANRAHGIAQFGRVQLVAAACAALAAGALVELGALRANAQLAAFTADPAPGVLARLMNQSAAPIAVGVNLLLGAPTFLFLAALTGLDARRPTEPRGRWAAAGPILLVLAGAVLVTAMMLARGHARVLEAAARLPILPRPADVAGELLGLVRAELICGVCLAVMGLALGVIALALRPASE